MEMEGLESYAKFVVFLNLFKFRIMLNNTEYTPAKEERSEISEQKLSKYAFIFRFGILYIYILLLDKCGLIFFFFLTF